MWRTPSSILAPSRALIVAVVVAAVFWLMPVSSFGQDPIAGISKEFTDVETWVWERILQGEAADLNQREGRGRDPEQETHWTTGAETRIINKDFLQKIAVDNDRRGLVPPRGIRIIGALFDQGLDAYEIRVPFPIQIERSVATGVLDFKGARVTSSLIFRRCAFSNHVWMSGADIAGSLRFADCEFRKALDLNNLDLGQNLRIDASRIGESLLLNGAQIGRGVRLERNRVGVNIEMNDLKGDYQISLISNRVEGEIQARGLRCGATLEMEGGRAKGLVDFTDARIQSRALFRGVDFQERLQSDGMRVGGTMTLNECRLESHTSRITRQEIGGDLQIRLCALTSVDMSGSKINGQLRLGDEGKGNEWREKAIMSLRNTTVGSIADDTNAWPNRLQLAGFEYLRFDSAAQREVGWILSWLDRQQYYVPAPFHWMAKILDEAGLHSTAERIRYEARYREEHNSSLGRAAWLRLLRFTIGYNGCKLYRLIYWYLGLLVIGTAVVMATSGPKPPEGKRKHMSFLNALEFSFIALFPTINLWKEFFDTPPSNRAARWYFYVHKYLGYLLLALLIAGLMALSIGMK